MKNPIRAMSYEDADEVAALSEQLGYAVGGAQIRDPLRPSTRSKPSTFGPSGVIAYNDGIHGTLFYAFGEHSNTVLLTWGFTAPSNDIPSGAQIRT